MSENGYLQLIQNLVDGELALKTAIVDAQIAAGTLIRTSGDIRTANAAATLTSSGNGVRKAIAGFAIALIENRLITEDQVRAISDAALVKSRSLTARLEEACHAMIRELAQEVAPEGPTPQLMALLNNVGQAMGCRIDVVNLGSLATDGVVH